MRKLFYIDRAPGRGVCERRLAEKVRGPRVAFNMDGTREVLGLATGTSEAAPFWTEFLRSLTRRGLRGMNFVVSDTHEGLKAAIGRVFNAMWQHWRAHWRRSRSK